MVDHGIRHPVIGEREGKVTPWYVEKPADILHALSHLRHPMFGGQDGKPGMVGSVSPDRKLPPLEILYLHGAHINRVHPLVILERKPPYVRNMSCNLPPGIGDIPK